MLPQLAFRPHTTTIVNKMPVGAFFVWNTRSWRVRKQNFDLLSFYIHFRTNIKTKTQKLLHLQIIIVQCTQQRKNYDNDNNNNMW